MNHREFDDLLSDLARDYEAFSKLAVEDEVDDDWLSAVVEQVMPMQEHPPAKADSCYRFFTKKTIDDVTVVQAIDPYLQGTTVAELMKLELSQIVRDLPTKNLVVDLQNVKMISSSVISGLLATKRQLAASGGALKLCSMSDSLRYVFKTLQMDGTVFEIFESVESASDALHGDETLDREFER